jgi:hypothetical protein
MFERKTVFVLGAGASWHYGYPTGEQLVLDVMDLGKRLGAECQQHASGRYSPPAPSYLQIPTDQTNRSNLRRKFWQDLGNRCDDLVKKLETVDPLVIDYFLGWNPPLQEVGKLLIAAVILKCEVQYRSEKGNVNRRPVVGRSPQRITPVEMERINISGFKDNWYRFITHKLASNCKRSRDLLENQVQFITFNYDCSLEDQLKSSLSAIDIFEEDDVRQFLAKDRVIHVYGSVRTSGTSDVVPSIAFLTSPTYSLQWLNRQNNPHESSWIPFLERCYAAAAGIRTVDPHEKTDQSALDIARKFLRGAKTVYILGYGFDANNNERIGLGQIATSGPPKEVYFTNFQDANSVNRRVGVLFGNPKEFFGQFATSNLTGTNFEKSVRNVYDALELDFGLT